METKNQKIAIVGAGICGLYLAWKLSEKGFNVTVYERKKTIGKQACSGLFSRRILKFIPESEKLIQNRIKYALLHFPLKTIQINFTEEFLVMEHSQLDLLVADLAQKSGAKIVLDKKIDSLPVGVRVIGCDGALSLVRNNLKLKSPQFRLGIQGLVLERDYSEFVETWPTKSGFLWKIGRGQEVEYGIIEKMKTAKIIFDEFLVNRNIRLKHEKSALIPQGFIIPANDRVTLCGDAAGLTKPWSGGGVIWGLEAADILLKNSADFLKYRKEVGKFFLPKILFSNFITRTVYFLGFNFPWLLPGKVKIESDFLIKK